MKMDYFDSNYYQLNRKLLLIVGQWPYQRYADRVKIWIAYICVMTSVFVTEMAKIVTAEVDFDLGVEMFSDFLTLLIALVRYFYYSVYDDEARVLLDNMKFNWQCLMDDNEHEIFSKTTEDGRLYTLNYIIFIFSLIVAAWVIILSSPVLIYLNLINDSYPRYVYYPAEYFIDEEKYYYLILAHMNVALVVFVIGAVATDAFFMVLMYHNIAMFKIACYRLEHVFDICDDKTKSTSGRKNACQKTANAVESHKRAVRFFDKIVTMSEWPNLISLVLVIMNITVSLYWAAMSKERGMKMMMGIMFGIGMMFHMLMIEIPAQRITDNSGIITYKAYSSLWYMAPVKEQSLVLLTMQRGLRPCVMTMGKVYSISLENYAGSLTTAYGENMVSSTLIIHSAMIYTIHAGERRSKCISSIPYASCTDYYQLNRKLLLLVGQWPYQSLADKVKRWILYLCTVATVATTQVAKVMTAELDFNMCIDMFSNDMAISIGIVRYFLYAINNDKTRSLVDNMKLNWQSLMDDEEYDIFSESAEEGRLYASHYLLFAYLVLVASWIVVFSPPLLKYMNLVNDSYPVIVFYPAEYFIDEKKYDYLILAHMNLVILVMATAILATDTFYMVLMFHAIGMFKIACYRLEHAFDHFYNKTRHASGRTNICERIACAVEYHKHAIRFCDTIVTTFEWANSISLLLVVISVTVSFYWSVVSQGQGIKMVLGMLLGVVQLVHMFSLDLPAQKIADNSNEVVFKAYSSLWYKGRVKEQGLLLLIIQRGLKPSTMMMGKVYPMSLEHYATEVKTAFSYFTVLISLK